MVAKILASVAALTAAAAIMLATVLALVRVTILAIAIADVRLRILAACADIVLGTCLLVACIYLATQLAVRVLGVGNAAFPPPPQQSQPGESPALESQSPGESSIPGATLG
jgi:hypothetical protein